MSWAWDANALFVMRNPARAPSGSFARPSFASCETSGFRLGTEPRCGGQRKRAVGECLRK